MVDSLFVDSSLRRTFGVSIEIGGVPYWLFIQLPSNNNLVGFLSIVSLIGVYPKYKMLPIEIDTNTIKDPRPTN